MSSVPQYRIESFPASAPDGHADARTAAWLQAVEQGFHGPRQEPWRIDRAAAACAADGRTFTGVYCDEVPAGSLGPEVPVATFASYTKGIAVGGGASVPAHLISDVTVRPTHRRRGLLRRLMTESLAGAHARGLALAALTVSEATIYGRFGFGVASWVSTVTVATDRRFRMLAAPPGHCELAEPLALGEIAPAVFARFHAANPGSVDRQQNYWNIVTGVAGEKAGQEGDLGLRAAVHYDEAGEIDGYVAYRFAGWDTEPRRIDVVDLVAADAGAYLGLWDFLASVDLVDEVRYEVAPADDPLRWALSDWRAVAASKLEDWLWLRLLDVPAAFEARAYQPTAADELVLDVSDELGYAAGRFRLRVADGTAHVTREPAPSGSAATPSGGASDAIPARSGADLAPSGAAPAPAGADLALDAATLATLYLGAADPRVLHRAARLTEHTRGAAARLAALLAPVAPVYGLTHF